LLCFNQTKPMDVVLT